MAGSPVQITPVPSVRIPSKPGNGWIQTDFGWHYSPTRHAEETAASNKPIPGSEGFPERRFRANQVGGFDANYYLNNNQDVLDNFNQWSNDTRGMHFADYVRANSGLEDAWSSTYNQHNQSRWDWGATHWNDHGKNENRIKPLVVGGVQHDPSDTRTIWTGPGQDQAKADFGAWHFDTYGRNEGRYENESSWYMSPEQQEIRDAAVAAQLLKIAEGAEASRLASMRGGGSQNLSASGAATFKGKGLTSSENKRGKGRGTGQFKRPYGASNLSIAATGKGNQQSTLNL